jgi:hypothetical protein
MNLIAHPTLFDVTFFVLSSILSLQKLTENKKWACSRGRVLGPNTIEVF